MCWRRYRHLVRGKNRQSKAFHRLAQHIFTANSFELLGRQILSQNFFHFNSEIYCHGRLLDTVQMARIYNDSKTFVDMKLKQSPDVTLQAFDNFMEKFSESNKPSKDQIQEWVEQNFDPRGSEFENWTPDDFKKDPEILNKINDKELRNFASDLNGVWLELGRLMKKDVAANPELYSIIYVENPVIVPGGRFLEFYYWDSYWIIRGLLHSEMVHVSWKLSRLEIWFAQISFSSHRRPKECSKISSPSSTVSVSSPTAGEFTTRCARSHHFSFRWWRLTSTTPKTSVLRLLRLTWWLVSLTFGCKTISWRWKDTDWQDTATCHPAPDQNHTARMLRQAKNFQMKLNARSTTRSWRLLPRVAWTSRVAGSSTMRAPTPEIWQISNAVQSSPSSSTRFSTGMQKLSPSFTATKAKPISKFNTWRQRRTSWTWATEKNFFPADFDFSFHFQGRRGGVVERGGRYMAWLWPDQPEASSVLRAHESLSAVDALLRPSKAPAHRWSHCRLYQSDKARRLPWRSADNNLQHR